ncbi:MAG: M16 family metallopeptidase [Candidatus Eiseniibacteriota bacterium]
MRGLRAWVCVAAVLATRGLAAAALGTAALAILAASHASATDTGDLQFPPTKEVTLPNGAKLILAEKHDVPLIGVIAYLRGGSLTDPVAKEGVAELTAEMLEKGAGKRSAQEIAATVDGAGASLDVGANYENWWVSAEFLSRDQVLMVEMLSDVLRHPTFPDSEFLKVKQQSVDAIRSEKDSPYRVLSDYARGYFYGANPYGRPLDGDETTVGALTRDDLIATYKANFGGDRLILAVVGDFDTARMESALRTAFGDWAKAPGTLPSVPAVERRTGRRVLLVDKPDAKQTYFWMGNLGQSRTDPDRVPVDVANTYFGGRYTSLLNSALRIRTGLTYDARTVIPRYTVPGYVAIVSYTKTESTQRAIDLALETLTSFRRTGLDSTALSSVQHYIAGLYPTTLETEDQIAGRLALLALYRLPATEATQYVGRVRAVERKRLNDLASRFYPDPKDLTIVMIGNAATIRSVARRYGPVSEITIDKPLISALRTASK